MADQEYVPEPVDEVEKLEDQLAHAKLCKQLEDARDAMHEDRTDEAAMALYKELSQQVADSRVAFRIKYPPPPVDPQSGDAVATPETVAATGGVHQG